MTASLEVRVSIVITATGNRAGTGDRGPGTGRPGTSAQEPTLGSDGRYVVRQACLRWAISSDPSGIGPLSTRRDPCRSPVPGPRSRGFTLLEMLAVIVLIAIAVTVTAVSLNGRSRGQLDATAQRVAAGLRDTRTRAMATSRPQGFVVDLRDRSFAAPGRDPRTFPAGTSVQVTSAAELAPADGIAQIRYYPDGSSSGGRIVLSERKRSVTVAVDWLTGAVTVDHGATK
ncbi:MAG: prepilin-type N-terminal cleavage/methylation domain-containing protein [Rhodanobacteraceae bacterium]